MLVFSSVGLGEAEYSTGNKGVINTQLSPADKSLQEVVIKLLPVDHHQGVPTYTGDLGATSAPANPLASINPNDIESIDIAKDAAATAIYGSRAANGVVFIKLWSDD
jgi:TonB-dependent SusC/RagA subfamily outer membrane receptor